MTEPASGTRQPAPADHRWLILVIVAIAQLMVVLDATVVNIALPSAQRALGFPNADRQWIVTAYALPFGALLLLGWRIGDYLGRKKILMIALGGFALASALGGIAQNFIMLAGARALQGVFAAMLAPSALSMLTVTFRDPKERAKAFAVFGAIIGGGAAVGLVLGGLLTEYATWRWCLLVNIPISVVAIVGTWIYRPDRAEFEIETDSGEHLQGRGSVKELVEDWDLELDAEEAKSAYFAANAHCRPFWRGPCSVEHTERVRVCGSLLSANWAGRYRLSRLLHCLQFVSTGGNCSRNQGTIDSRQCVLGTC